MEGLSPLLLKSGGAIAPLAPPIATPMNIGDAFNLVKFAPDYQTQIYFAIGRYIAIATAVY